MGFKCILRRYYHLIKSSFSIPEKVRPRTKKSTKSWKANEGDKEYPPGELARRLYKEKKTEYIPPPPQKKSLRNEDTSQETGSNWKKKKKESLANSWQFQMRDIRCHAFGSVIFGSVSLYCVVLNFINFLVLIALKFRCCLLRIWQHAMYKLGFYSLNFIFYRFICETVTTWTSLKVYISSLIMNEFHVCNMNTPKFLVWQEQF